MDKFETEAGLIGKGVDEGKVSTAVAVDWFKAGNEVEIPNWGNAVSVGTN